MDITTTGVQLSSLLTAGTGPVASSFSSIMRSLPLRCLSSPVGLFPRAQRLIAHSRCPHRRCLRFLSVSTSAPASDAPPVADATRAAAVSPARPRPALSRRLSLRGQSARFAFVEPEAEEEEEEEEEQDDNDGSDDDLSDVVDRSASARSILFSTLLHVQRLERAEVSPDYVEAVVESLRAHSPLLAREEAHIAASWLHLGREEEAAVWIRRMVQAGHMSRDWAQLLRQKAAQAACGAAEQRMSSIERLIAEGKGPEEALEPKAPQQPQPAQRMKADAAVLKRRKPRTAAAAAATGAVDGDETAEAATDREAAAASASQRPL